MTWEFKTIEYFKDRDGLAFKVKDDIGKHQYLTDVLKTECNKGWEIVCSLDTKALLLKKSVQKK